jgi:hypothetical protein
MRRSASAHLCPTLREQIRTRHAAADADWTLWSRHHAWADQVTTQLGSDEHPEDHGDTAWRQTRTTIRMRGSRGGTQTRSRTDWIQFHRLEGEWCVTAVTTGL